MEMQITVTSHRSTWGPDVAVALSDFADSLRVELENGFRWNERDHVLYAGDGTRIGEVNVSPVFDDETVAVVYDRHTGDYVDECHAWQAGQSYALHEGHRVEAVADDGRMDVETAQALYDQELALYIDCWE